MARTSNTVVGTTAERDAGAKPIAPARAGAAGDDASAADRPAEGRMGAAINTRSSALKRANAPLAATADGSTTEAWAPPDCAVTRCCAC